MQKNKLILLSLLILPLVLATFPGIPHQFYGNVQINNQTASGGLVTSKIDNITVAETRITLGKYGYNPIFFIQDPDFEYNGKEITFYINGLEARKFIFENGESTNLNLSVSGYAGVCGNSILDNGESCDDGSLNGVRCDNSNSDCTYCSTSCKIVNLNEQNDNHHSSSSSGSRLSFSSCTPDWKCSQWGECVEGFKQRNCVDQNNCEITVDKPSETNMCDSVSLKLQSKLGENSSTMLWILIGGIIVIALLAFLVNRIVR